MNGWEETEALRILDNLPKISWKMMEPRIKL